MQHGLTSNVNYKFALSHVLGWIFGILVLMISLINILWGNDPGFGAFLLLLSFVYFPPANALLYEIGGISLPVWLKFLLAVFIIVAALGVGELPAKIDMMLKSVS